MSTEIWQCYENFYGTTNRQLFCAKNGVILRIAPADAAGKGLSSLFTKGYRRLCLQPQNRTIPTWLPQSPSKFAGFYRGWLLVLKSRLLLVLNAAFDPLPLRLRC